MGRLSRHRIDEAVNKWGKDTVRKIRAALTREKGVSTKKLWNSIRYRYFAKSGIIEFSMEPYGAFWTRVFPEPAVWSIVMGRQCQCLITSRKPNPNTSLSLQKRPPAATCRSGCNRKAFRIPWISLSGGRSMPGGSVPGVSFRTCSNNKWMNSTWRWMRRPRLWSKKLCMK